LINVSSVLSKVLLVLKPFMNKSVSQMLNFHLPNTTALYDYVSQDLLPNEYGGKAGSMKDIKKSYVKQLEEHREYLTSDMYWKPRDSNNNSQNSHFSSLDID